MRELSKFLGLLSSSIQAVFPAPLHYRYLQQANPTNRTLGSSPSRLRVPSGGTVVERQSNSRERESPTPTNNRPGHRDRCLSQRLGGLLPGSVNRRQMASPRDLIPHQLARAACRLTSYNVLGGFRKNKARAQVLLLMDNISAVTCINKMGGTHSPIMSYLARNLWD